MRYYKMDVIMKKDINNFVNMFIMFIHIRRNNSSGTFT